LSYIDFVGVREFYGAIWGAMVGAG